MSSYDTTNQPRNEIKDLRDVNTQLHQENLGLKIRIISMREKLQELLDELELAHEALRREMK
jgi:predicted  nucleic acid-binding Zn-ribbon protein